MGESRSVGGVVLLLPGGTPRSVRRPSPVAAATMLPLARRFARTGREAALAVHVVRYRYRGWNGEAAHTAGDAEWAVDEVVRRYGDVPVCLAGTDVGARAALRAAGHPAVASVLALAPWLPEEEPVRHLAGRSVLLVHGTDDAHSDPERSLRLAERAKKLNADVCRFEVHTDGHALYQHRHEVAALAGDFVLGTLCERDFCRPLTDAMAAPPPLGLRMPLATGFGRSLHR
jgi:dienelactone hydrolase